MHQAALSDDQLVRWLQAQQGETGFWKEWLSNNQDHGDTRWLQHVQGYFELPDHHDFGQETLVDLGSGPVGLLTRFTARDRICIDPLPIDSLDKTVTRIKAPAEETGLRPEIADRVFIYNLLQHVISPEHVLAECLRILKADGTVYIVEQLNLPTDQEHPHSLKIEMFDQWVQREHLEVLKRTTEHDCMLSSVSKSQPGTGYVVLCLIARKPRG
jgi:SAM-dependent methyltransferase